jgi:hypothetical protein
MRSVAEVEGGSYTNISQSSRGDSEFWLGSLSSSSRQLYHVLLMVASKLVRKQLITYEIEALSSPQISPEISIRWTLLYFRVVFTYLTFGEGKSSQSRFLTVVPTYYEDILWNRWCVFEKIHACGILLGQC